MLESQTRNPDQEFVLHGRKTPIRERDDEYLSNSQKTLTSKNLSSSFNFSKSGATSFDATSRSVPDIADLERSINELKLELTDLNQSLSDSYGKSDIFLQHSEPSYNAPTIVRHSYEKEDPELTFLMQRNDEEAVSHTAPGDTKWYEDPKHLTKPLGDYPTMQGLGVSKRSVSPINRSVGRFGAEIATKDVTGDLTSLDVASNNITFPVRLTAPHIVGVRSLLPPQYPVRHQDKERAKSPRSRSRSVELGMLRSRSLSPGRSRGRSGSRGRARDRSPSPLPVWMPTSRHANASSQPPPPVKKNARGRSPARRRPATASGYRQSSRSRRNLSKSLPITRHSLHTNYTRYKRPTVQPRPGRMELEFLEATDQLDTRRALVEKSPFQQQLSRLRLERLRVEEEYLLQLKRESELERIRGPKPKWYEMKGPQFHYECNKNTSLHKNRDQWGDTMRYRNSLLQASREFADNMVEPVMN
uniref:Uncharacterized protein LOC100177264 n=1 Tax=Phallusia mammillata TaxID=59560 RepID=A0A6F9DFY1_9ASCI|nr:uncharacterized protein LOC100177264 [Phallusia mammillata]